LTRLGLFGYNYLIIDKATKRKGDDEMKVLVKRPFENFEIVEIKGELEEYQKIVGGYIETYRIDDEYLLICNEEGKLIGLEPNMRYRGDVIVGPIIFAKYNHEGEILGLAGIEEADKLVRDLQEEGALFYFNF
jgi:uncharacterized protein YuzE